MNLALLDISQRLETLHCPVSPVSNSLNYMDRIDTQRSHGSFLDVTFDFGLLRFLRKHFRNWFRFHLNRLHAFLAWFPFLNSPFFRPSTKARVAFCIMTEVSFISFATSLRSETASFRPMLCRLSTNTWSLYDQDQKTNQS